MRVGIGHDTHRLVPGGPLRLGGLQLDYPFHLQGHSDADVLLHAIMDALLGAAGLGDIGELFPDTDPIHRGRDSAEMVGEVLNRVNVAGFGLRNIDCIVFAQEPKLSPYKSALRDRIASLLELPAQQVNIKAKTGESVGTVGRKEALMAQAVVLIEPLPAGPIREQREGCS
jgi:2-C-methyl-D-erythritol 2,4-cyclodiphosphate synthase